MTIRRWPQRAPPGRLLGWLLLYILLWTGITQYLDPALPYDAVEAMNWGQNGEWGSPKNPWLVGAMMRPLLYFPALSPEHYWYLCHFVVIAGGMLGVWMLTRRLTGQADLAWLALMSLNLSGSINIDMLPYNDNYLLVGLWPWLFWALARALATDSPRWGWPLFALLAGLATMAKYSTVALLLLLLLATLISPSLRPLYRQRRFWLAIAIYFALVTPNALWLTQHQFAAIHWVSGQLHPEPNLHASLAMLTVFYPLLIVTLLVYLSGGRLHWPAPGALRLSLLMLLIPLALILLWLTLYRGGRITEWLQPFAIPAIALLCASLRGVSSRQIRRLSRGLSLLAPLVLCGYAVVYLLDLRGCGQEWSGLKPFARQAETFWRQQSPTPLRLVGGDYLHQWLLVYAIARPRTIHPWRRDTPTPPNIYTPGITQARIERDGVLLVGRLGAPCSPAAFRAVWRDWPELQPHAYRQIDFVAQPGAPHQPLCLAIVPPRRGTNPAE